MKRWTTARQALLASLLAGTTFMSTGCSSGGFPMASMNPFAKPKPTSIGESPSVTESIAATTAGAGNQVKAVTVGAKDALGRTANAMTSVFRRKSDEPVDAVAETDPLRLDNKPEKVNPDVFVANGQLWEATGDFGKAMESYTKALASDANNAPALTSMARLHFRQNDLPNAALAFQKAIAQNPEDAGLYNDLGLTLSKMGNHAGAVATLERALQLAPGTSRYANNLASVKFESGDPVAALNVLTTNNKPAVAHFNMAYLHYKSGQMPQARQQLVEAIKFESQAAGDTAVQRAVERSREMLAQINAGTGTIAQAAPQATATPGTGPTVRQTSQSTATSSTVPNISTASSMAPAMAAITTPPSIPTTSGPSKSASPATASQSVPSWSQAWNPNWKDSAKTSTTSSPTTPSPTTTGNPPKPTRPTAATATDDAKTGSGPTVPMSMPSGFTMPQ